MKKSIFLGGILIAALSFTSCESSKNGGDLTINAKVENGADFNNLVDEVRALGGIRVKTWYYEDWDEWYYEWQEVIITSGFYKNGGFKLTLPVKELDIRLLEDFDHQLQEFGCYIEDMPSKSISISNKNVNAAIVECFEAYKNNEYVDDLLYGYINYTLAGYNQTFAGYIYVDADVKITGSYTYEDDYYYNEDYTETEKYDANLKKGWNTVYMTYEGTAKKEVKTFTTKKPKVDLKWYFEENIAFYSPENGNQETVQEVKQKVVKQKENKHLRGFRSFKLFK